MVRRYSMLSRKVAEQSYVEDCLHLLMTIFTFRPYPHTPHSGSTRWSHCGSFRALRYDNDNDNEDCIWITLIASFQNHGQMVCAYSCA